MGRPSNSDQRREQIVAAFQEVLAVQGYDGASVAAVARKAGLAPGLVHYHFENKHEILLSLVETLTGVALRRIDAAMEGAPPEPLARLDRLLDAFLGLQPALASEVPCWVVIAMEAMRTPEVGRCYRGFLDDVLGRLEAEVANALRGTGSSSRRPAAAANARRIAAAMMAAIQGYFVLSAAAPAAVPSGTAAASAKEMLRGLLTGGAA